MKKTWFWRSMLVAVAMLGAQRAPAAAASEGATLLVIPSRYTVVQFAFDVARTRSLYLLAYDQPATGGDLQLYAWDNSKAKWIGVAPGDVGSGALFNEPPAQVVLVGDDRTLPDAVGAAVDPNGKAKRITSLQLVDILNGLDGALQFTPREWKWFASRYGFQLDDRNAERRRWGRYGPPGGSSRPAADEVDPPAAGEVVMPVAMPQAVIEEAAPAQERLVIPAAVEQNTPPAPAEAAIETAAPVPAPVEAVPVTAGVKPEDK